MDIGYAIEHMRMGRSVRLPHWQPDVKLQLQVPDANSKMTAPYIYVESRFGRVPWVCTQIELLSDAWEYIGEPNDDI